MSSHIVKARSSAGTVVVHEETLDTQEPQDRIINDLITRMREQSLLKKPWAIDALLYYVDGELEALETAYFFEQERLEDGRREKEHFSRPKTDRGFRQFIAKKKETA